MSPMAKITNKQMSTLYVNENKFTMSQRNVQPRHAEQLQLSD